MKEQDYVDAMLQEAFDLMSPFKTGGSDWANREAALRGKIVAYLGKRGKTVTLYGPGGGAGGPAAFGVGGAIIGPTFAFATGSGGRAGGSGMGGGGGTYVAVVTPGGNGFGSSPTHALQQAKSDGVPVCYAGGGGGGMEGYKDWTFPDGHTERLPADETPKWPKDNPLHDAIRANP